MFNQFKPERDKEEEGVLVPLKGRDGKPHKNPDGTVPHLRIAGPYSAPGISATTRAPSSMPCSRRRRSTFAGSTRSRG